MKNEKEIAYIKPVIEYSISTIVIGLVMMSVFGLCRQWLTLLSVDTIKLCFELGCYVFGSGCMIIFVIWVFNKFDVL